MASAAERRAAQRQLAKQIHSGTYRPDPKIRAAYKGGIKEQAKRYVHSLDPNNLPPKDSEGGKLIGRYASYAAHDPDYDYEYDDYGWAEDYWYHDD